MLNKSNGQVNGNKIPPYAFSDEVTKRKIRRHLKDINDVITEKDIKNAKIPGVEEELPAATSLKKGKKADKNVVDDTPGNPATPWDILSE